MKYSYGENPEDYYWRYLNRYGFAYALEKGGEYAALDTDYNSVPLDTSECGYHFYKDAKQYVIYYVYDQSDVSITAGKSYFLLNNYGIHSYGDDREAVILPTLNERVFINYKYHDEVLTSDVVDVSKTGTFTYTDPTTSRQYEYTVLDPKDCQVSYRLRMNNFLADLKAGNTIQTSYAVSYSVSYRYSDNGETAYLYDYSDKASTITGVSYKDGVLTYTFLGVEYTAYVDTSGFNNTIIIR